MPAAASHFVMALSDEFSPVQEGVDVLRGHTDQAFENILRNLHLNHTYHLRKSICQI